MKSKWSPFEVNAITVLELRPHTHTHTHTHTKTFSRINVVFGQTRKVEAYALYNCNGFYGEWF